MNATAIALAHKPVLVQEVIEHLGVREGGYYIDGTLGAGGHSKLILEASSPSGRLLAFDVDAEAIEAAKTVLAQFSERLEIRKASYVNMAAVVAELDWPLVDGILLDLGASSIQFDQAQRGFSFRNDGPIDMRFDPESDHPASVIVNEWSEQGIAELIKKFGEQGQSRRIARAIVRARPIESTKQLAEIIARALRAKKRGVHPATKTFQALRIAVNSELDQIQEALPIALSLLKPGGRLAVISFHSLEDRIVKQFFVRESTDCICPPEQLICTCGHSALIKRINRKPITASEDELADNPRARSAKLRVAEKLEVSDGT